MTGYTSIDLSQLAPPDVVERLDFETILSAMKDRLVTLAPDLAPVLALESETVVKVLQVCAYRETLMRAEFNDRARGCYLATATGADLDNLAAFYGVQRLVITPADPDAVPPVAAVMESDSDLRRRTQLAPESFSTAGPAGAYEFHALSADADVLDASAVSLLPGEVTVSVLSRSGTGAASGPLVAAVLAALSAEDVRPLSDTVGVQSAAIVTYAITAQLLFLPGPDRAVVLAAAQAAATAYAAAQHRLGRDITLSGVYAALHQPGVQRVNLIAPAANIVIGVTQASWCTAITLTDGGVDE